MPTIGIKETLERLIGRKHVRFFVDTQFLLQDEGLAALDNVIIGFLHSQGAPIVVPYPVLAELQKLSKSVNSPDLATNAKKALQLVEKRRIEGQLRILGSGNEKFADQTFYDVFTRFQTKYDLLLFSNNKDLSRDILGLNQNESNTSCKNEIWVARHNGHVLIAGRRIADLITPNGNSSGSRKQNHSTPIFQKFDKPRELDTSLVGGNHKFKTGDAIKTERGKRLKLGASLASGGEGEIFELDRERVAKIYYPDRRTSWRSEKLAAMCRKTVNLKGVNWPCERLLGPDNLFVGYLMPMAKGIPLQHAVFGKATIQENFPTWNRLNLVILARTVAQTVSSLNQIGVIIGDINPMNFLVSSETEVQLVDVDSVQIEDFPCPVGMVSFRAPEITEASYEKFLRNEQHEAFALASLLFMVLMGGKPPFSFQGGGDPSENIRKGNFPYASDHGLIPAGAFRFIWSFFPYRIQNAFTQAFIGKDQSTRPSADQWFEILGHYCKGLQHPKFSESLTIWPTSFKMRNNQSSVQLKCAGCFTEFQTSASNASQKRTKHREILCPTCVTVRDLAKKAGKNHHCNQCGKLFRVAYHEIDKHGKVFDLCGLCLAKIAAQERRCRNCNGIFRLDVGETRFLLTKGLDLPKRCDSCRGKTTSTKRINTTNIAPPPRPTPSHAPLPSQLPRTPSQVRPRSSGSLWDRFWSFLD